jgi:fatty acid desaturase
MPAPLVDELPARPTSDVRPAPRAERARDRSVSVYAELSQQVKDAGLLNRRRPYYVVSIALTVAAFAGVWVAIVAVGDSWWQLGLAVVLSLVCTQFGFLGHDTAHRQAFGSHRVNEWSARVLSCGFAGIGYGWWMQKHNRHHNAPNQMGKDPDIVSEVLAFTPDDAAERTTGLRGWFTRYQGWAFFPLLCFEGAALHANSIATLLRDKSMPHRRLEVTIIALRLGLFVAAVFLVMPPLLAVGFIVVQQAVFGLLLGGSFAPNHKGMPVVPKNAKVDFLRRQVLMSRNIRGGLLTDFMMGGLNYQIEHHLFPSMPRPNLRKVQPMVREHCAKHGISYTETSLVGSYRMVVRYLNRVGLGERDPFVCPLVQSARN